MRHIGYFIATALLGLFLLLVVYEGYSIVLSVFDHLPDYQWFFYGIIAYTALYLLISSPMRGIRRHAPWLYDKLTILKHNLNHNETDTHEHDHNIIGQLFFRRIYSSHVEENSGAVQMSGGSEFSQPFVSLAPYCIPLYVIVLLFFRCITAHQYFWILDILIGFVFAFQIVAIYKDIGIHQSDIKKFPVWFSYTFIVTILTFNIVVILCAILDQETPNPHHPSYNPYNLLGALKHLFEQFYNDIINLFH